MVDAGDARRGGGSVDSVALLQIVGTNDRLADLFRSHIRLLRLLEDMPQQDSPRRPYSPFGAEMSADVRAEQVTPEDVLALLRSDTRPFGSRAPILAFGETAEAQDVQFREALKNSIARSGGDPALLTDDQFEELVGRLRSELSGTRLDPPHDA